MVFSVFKNVARRFRDDTRGTITMETVITLPLLIWALCATYEFFEVHRYKAAREKATYTVADMFSRETIAVDPTYMDNTLALFDGISNDDGTNQIRVSIVHYDADEDEYSIKWSQVRGTGTLVPLADQDVAQSHATLPVMGDGIELILVESKSIYTPLFNVGLGPSMDVQTRVFTAIRFEPTICWVSCT